MGNIFTNKRFSNYLGENRAILDVITDYEEVVVPSPTPTPTSVTSTPTPTPTITPTPSPIQQFDIGSGFDATTQAIFIDGSDNIFVGGAFYGYDGTPSWGLVKIDTDGNVGTTFAAGSNTLLYSGTINQIVGDETGNYIYVVGSSTTPGRIVKIDKTTGLNVWSGVTTATNGVVQSVAVDALGDVYISGTFTSVQGLTRNRIAKLDTNGTIYDSVFTGTSFPSGSVTNIFINRNGNLICSGTFPSYSGITSNRIIEIETSTYTKTALWGSGQSGGGTLDIIYQRSDDGEYVCVGNTTYTINGASPSYVGKYDESGVNIPFTPTGIPTAIPIGLYLDEVNNYMYIGNTGYGNTGILRVDLVGGAVDTTFSTNIGVYLPKTISVQPLSRIIQLDSSNRIYRIGTFVFINGDGYNRIVRYLQDGTINTISG
jgi:hypothetical protein